jgi:SAM-dependent methyltransferase
MLLSKLVKLKLELTHYLDTTAIKQQTAVVTDNLRALRTTDAGIDYDKHISDIIKVIDKQVSQLDKAAQTKYLQIIEDIDLKIQAQSSKYFQSGYKTYVTSITDERENRKLPLTDDIRNTLLGRIQLYSDWHYPGMEIGCRDGEFTPHLVANDPLYLVEVRHEYLESTMSKFSIEYQDRLRPYYIGHTRNEKGLRELPQNEFGFIFSWNVFNYLPLDEIKKYLFDIINVLRPGGTFLFSFNDGESYNGAQHVEWGGMSYIPKSLLIAIAEGHGFEVTASYGFETEWHNISWLEIKKSGSLSTNKAHQTLGIIKDIEQ